MQSDERGENISSLSVGNLGLFTRCQASEVAVHEISAGTFALLYPHTFVAVPAPITFEIGATRSSHVWPSHARSASPRYEAFYCNQ